MSEVRSLRPGEAVALSALTRSPRRPGDLVVSVVVDGVPPDVVALLLGPDGRVRTYRDLVFFHQPTSAGGGVRVDPSANTAEIRTGALEEQVARVLVACAGGALDTARGARLRVDVAHPVDGVLATALIEVPAHHRAETLVEVYRRGTGWRLRLLGQGYPTGLDGLVRDHGVEVEDSAPSPAAPSSPPPAAPSLPPAAPSSPPPAAPSLPPAVPFLPPASVASATFAPAPTSATWTTLPPQPVPAPRRRRRVGALVGAGAAALVAVVLGATFAGGSDPVPRPSAVAATSSAAASTTSPPVAATPLAAATAAVVPVAAAAQAELVLLPVKGRAPLTGYDRAQFGQAWADVDRNGCDTRNDVLRRDVRGAAIDPRTRGCVVLSGAVDDPYSGTTIPFTRGADTSADVQIDHVVALADAWQTGAQHLDAGRREQFANDPANLLAVDGTLNQQKGAGDAATWLPPNRSFRCTYVTMQVAVKREYGLWVTAAERDAIARVLATCPGATTPPAPTTAVPSTSAAPPTAPPAPATTVAVPPPADGGGSVSYRNCDAVRAAGKAPLLAGEPGYSRKLDRDGDGVACE